jgi:ATP-binding cassette, subfamily B, bacterial
VSVATVDDDLALDEEDLPVPEHLRGTRAVLVRGLRESRELRRGLALTAVISLGATLSGLMGPILIQQIFDHGFTGGFRARFVHSICSIALALLVVSYFAGRAAGRRLVRASERALTRLRTRTFAHIHDLSLAEQSRERRGVFVARVTADIDTLSKFTEWGMVAWIVAIAQIAGSLALMLAYSWQLTIPVVLLVIPLVAIMVRMQKTLSAAFDRVRTTVGQMLSEVSESVMGAGVVRAYGLEERIDIRVKHSIDRRYRAQVVAHLRAATMFPIAAVFWGVALSVVVVFGTTFGPEWGLTLGQTAAFLFLADLFLRPFVDLPEIYAQTQTAISGWRKVLAMLDMPVEIVEPSPGHGLGEGAVSVRADGVSYSYASGRPVVRDVDVQIEAGGHVAIVGQTGSGKTTFAKLLCRLADPREGRILLDGVDLREVTPAARRTVVRMVPQDGFLFDLTVLENIRAGCDGGSDHDVETAIGELGLTRWVETLPEGLHTRVGPRGESLSVGERQLVSLARAQIGNPGLLILDEATSSVDPATELRISQALRRLSAGRTTVTIAHRLSTAEAADSILVFEHGRIAERGTHTDLVAMNGVYARLHESWLGTIGTEGADHPAWEDRGGS